MPATSRRRVVRAVVLTVAAVLVVAFVVVAASAVLLVRRPLPDYSGQVTLDGLSAEVEVVRDAQGVPQIYAADARDLFRAQGYVHAQDRFFEMDYRRHVAEGRLAELVGDDAEAIASDAAVRTLGWADVAEAELALLGADTRAYLEAYADGVNDYLDGREASRLAVEYSLLGLTRDLPEIEPWTPLDSLTWLKAAAWDMTGGDEPELERAGVYGIVSDVARVDELFPAYPEDVNPTILEGGAAAPTTRTAVADADGTESAFLALGGGAGLEALTETQHTLAAVTELIGEGDEVGSNSWVVDGALTGSGAPIVALDPHLSPTAPGPWYQVGLHCSTLSDTCPFDVSGIGFSGLPGVLSGHNGSLAWAISSLPADTTDYFVERVLDNGTYIRDGERIALVERTETITVNGGDDVTVTVRSTDHGPLVSDVLPGSDESPSPGEGPSPLRGYGVSISWTGLAPGRTLDGVLALNRATSSADVAAAAALVGAPTQNILWATADGAYGYQAAGAVPERLTVLGAPLPSDGSWPRAGWVPAYDWQGLVAPARLPRAEGPDGGFLVVANQAVLPAGSGPFLTDDWDAGYRARQITALLEEDLAEGDPLTTGDMSAIQLDDANPYAAVLVPYLLRADVQDAFVEQGVDLLRTWDYRQSEDSAAAAYFASVWTNLLRLTFWDDVPPEFRPDGGSRWLEVVRRILEDPRSPWWDDRSTLNVVESRDEVLIDALTAARLQLTSSIGKDPTRWQWSTLHRAAPQHPLFGGDDDGGLVRDLVDPRPVAVGGGSSIVLATAWAAQDWDGDYPSFGVDSLPTARLVTDLGDLDSSTWVTLTGISGHPGSRFYTDQLGAWADGRTFPWPWSPEAVQEAERQTLRLVPAGDDAQD